MKKIKKTPLFWANAASVALLQKSISENRVSISSTDTILGFLASLTEECFHELNTLKEGRSNKPYLIITDTPEKLNHFIQIEKLEENIWNMIKQIWPGPVTIIFKAKTDTPKFLTSPQGTIAIRIPKHQGLLSILKPFPGLFSTSANKSSQPPAKTIEEIPDDILEKIAYLIIDEDYDKKPEQPSTIIDCSDLDKGIRVIREGAYPLEELEKHYGSPFNR